MACAMVLALVPVVAPTTAEAATTGATGTTALFKGNATYLLQERFNEPKEFTHGDYSNTVFSGWDIDYRGGSVKRTATGVATLTDTSILEKVSLSTSL